MPDWKKAAEYWDAQAVAETRVVAEFEDGKQVVLPADIANLLAEAEKRAADAEERLRVAKIQSEVAADRAAGERITAVAVVRKALGHTQAALAEAAGISRSYVELIEKGLVPTPAVKARVAKALGVPEEELWPNDTYTKEQAADWLHRKPSDRGLTK